MPDKKLEKGKERCLVGKVFNTPITVQGNTWLPLTQLVLWGIMTRRASKRNPEESFLKHLLEGALTTTMLLGSEWCHNLAHAYTADWIGKPMDELQIQWGMPRCRYDQLNDPDVSPRQHVIRSLGGPVFNLLMIPLAFIARSLTRPGSISREIANTALQTNMFLAGVSVLPIPGIDGGPILKWSLVDQGFEIEDADRVVQKVNGPLSGVLTLISGWSFIKNRHLLAIFSALMAIITFGIFTGRLKEDQLPK